MKILMINDSLKPSGGAEEVFLDEAAGLEKRGHQIILRDEQNLHLGSFASETFDLISLHNVFDPDLYEKLVSIAPTIHYVHDHRTYSVGSSRYHFRSNEICTAPLGLTHNLSYAYLEKCASRNLLKLITETFRKKRLLKIHNQLKKVIANSNYVKDQLVKNGVNKDLIEVVYPSRAEYRVEGQVTTDKPVVLFAGRLFVEKGAEYAIRAMQKVGNAYLWILGTGWDESRLKTMVKELNLETKVKFLGWLDKKEIGKIYEAATVGVVPSIWPEPFGLSGTNFMSLGKPVVGFDSGGIKEWLTDGETGFLVKRLDVQSLASSINTLLEDDTLRKKMGARAKAVFEEKFSLNVHLDKMEQIFSEVVK